MKDEHGEPAPHHDGDGIDAPVGLRHAVINPTNESRAS